MKVTADAAIDAQPCVVDAMYPALTLGSTTTPASGKYFGTISSGPYAGATEFRLAGRLDSNPKFDALFIEVPEPTAGFQANAPYVFQSDANANTYDAIAYILADIDTNTNSYAQILWASQGTITFSAISKTSTADIDGTVTMTPFRQIDDNTGTTISGGCATSVQSMSFFLKQNAAIPKDLGSGGALRARVDSIQALQRLN